MLQGKVPAATPKEHIGQQFHSGKRGKVPQESADRFKAPLPLAAAQFLNHAHNRFLKVSIGMRVLSDKRGYIEGDDDATCLNSKIRLQKRPSNTQAADILTALLIPRCFRSLHGLGSDLCITVIFFTLGQ